MGGDEIQTGKPELADNKPAAAPAPVNKEGDDNPFRLPEPVFNPFASIATCLALLGIIVPVICRRLVFLWVIVELVLGSGAVVFGILGVRYRNRNPAAGGLGLAFFAIVTGVLISLLALLALFLLALEEGIRESGGFMGGV